MEIFAIAGVGIVAVSIIVLLKQYKPEYAMFVSIAAGLLILTMIVSAFVPLIEEIRGITALADIQGEYIGILLKALGVCFITQIASDTCKDAGESAIATKLEMAGKITVLFISLPLFRQILNVAATMINL